MTSMTSSGTVECEGILTRLYVLRSAIVRVPTHKLHLQQYFSRIDSLKHLYNILLFFDSRYGLEELSLENTLTYRYMFYEYLLRKQSRTRDADRLTTLFTRFQQNSTIVLRSATNDTDFVCPLTRHSAVLAMLLELAGCGQGNNKENLVASFTSFTNVTNASTMANDFYSMIDKMAPLLPLTDMDLGIYDHDKKQIHRVDAITNNVAVAHDWSMSSGFLSNLDKNKSLFSFEPMIDSVDDDESDSWHRHGENNIMSGQRAGGFMHDRNMQSFEIIPSKKQEIMFDNLSQVFPMVRKETTPSEDTSLLSKISNQFFGVATANVPEFDVANVLSLSGPALRSADNSAIDTMVFNQFFGPTSSTDGMQSSIRDKSMARVDAALSAGFFLCRGRIISDIGACIQVERKKEVGDYYEDNDGDESTMMPFSSALQSRNLSYMAHFKHLFSTSVVVVDEYDVVKACSNVLQGMESNIFAFADFANGNKSITDVFCGHFYVRSLDDDEYRYIAVKSASSTLTMRVLEQCSIYGSIFLAIQHFINALQHSASPSLLPASSATSIFTLAFCAALRTSMQLYTSSIDKVFCQSPHTTILDVLTAFEQCKPKLLLLVALCQVKVDVPISYRMETHFRPSLLPVPGLASYFASTIPSSLSSLTTLQLSYNITSFPSGSNLLSHLWNMCKFNEMQHSVPLSTSSTSLPSSFEYDIPMHHNNNKVNNNKTLSSWLDMLSSSSQSTSEQTSPLSDFLCAKKKHSSVGDVDTKNSVQNNDDGETLRFVLKKVLFPLTKMVEDWCTMGSFVDPYNDFFVTVVDVEHNNENSINDEIKFYQLLSDRVPSFMTSYASSVFETGLSMSIIQSKSQSRALYHYCVKTRQKTSSNFGISDNKSTLSSNSSKFAKRLQTLQIRHAQGLELLCVPLHPNKTPSKTKYAVTFQNNTSSTADSSSFEDYGSSITATMQSSSFFEMGNVSYLSYEKEVGTVNNDKNGSEDYNNSKIKTLVLVDICVDVQSGPIVSTQVEIKTNSNSCEPESFTENDSNNVSYDLHASFGQTLQTQRINVLSFMHWYLVDVVGLMRYLSTMRDYFLMYQGDIMQTFTDSLFTAVSYDSQGITSHYVQTLFDTAALHHNSSINSSKKGIVFSKYENHSSRVRSNMINAKGIVPNDISTIIMKLQPWHPSFAMIVTSKAYAKYQLIFQFFLKIKYIAFVVRTLWRALQDVASAASQSTTAPRWRSKIENENDESKEFDDDDDKEDVASNSMINPCVLREFMLYRQEIHAFITVFQQHTITQVCSVSWRELQDVLDSAKASSQFTMTGLQKMHEEYIDKCYQRCFLSEVNSLSTDKDNNTTTMSDKALATYNELIMSLADNIFKQIVLLKRLILHFIRTSDHREKDVNEKDVQRSRQSLEDDLQQQYVHIQKTMATFQNMVGFLYTFLQKTVRKMAGPTYDGSIANNNIKNLSQSQNKSILMSVQSQGIHDLLLLLDFNGYYSAKQDKTNR